jgi:hypothetical protein
MYIRKNIVNDEEMMLQLPPKDRIKALHNDATIRDVYSRKVKQPSFRILDTPWDYVSDELFFDFSAIITPLGLLDKLKMLLILYSLYDPLGILLPFTLKGKLIMQLCWKLGLTWKSKLPEEILLKWQPWVEQIPELTGNSFKRTIMPGLNPEKLHHKLHVFADASKDTYAAVAYIRGEGQGETMIRIVQARSRIMPIKATHTIPRMELLGIELSLTLLKKLAKTYDIPPHDTFIWTDSRACYDWMRIETKSLQIFNHDNPLTPLAPFIDDRSHIRLGGRIEAANLAYSAKYLLLLHPKDPFTTILGRHIHILLCHTGGPRAIITELNKRFSCPKSTSLFGTIAYKCVPCRKRLAKPTKQIMAPLPFYRQPSARLHPFDHCAMDVAGPYKTKIGRSEVKRWLLILRCCTMNAVHCEMIASMDTSSFLHAIELFLAF